MKPCRINTSSTYLYWAVFEHVYLLPGRQSSRWWKPQTEFSLKIILYLPICNHFASFSSHYIRQPGGRRGQNGIHDCSPFVQIWLNQNMFHAGLHNPQIRYHRHRIKHFHSEMTWITEQWRKAGGRGCLDLIIMQYLALRWWVIDWFSYSCLHWIPHLHSNDTESPVGRCRHGLDACPRWLPWIRIHHDSVPFCPNWLKRGCWDVIEGGYSLWLDNDRSAKPSDPRIL